MRLIPDSSPFHINLKKSLSVVLCLALLGLEVAPAFARNNDDYQTNNNMYSNNYGPQGGYSAQSFDLQMQRMNARIQSFTAPPVQYFDSSRYVAPKLNLTYQPTIQFQFSPPVKTPEITTKTTIKLDSFTPVQKPTFMENVGQVFKGIGSAISSAFKKIGDGIVAVVQKMFGSTKKEVPMTTPQAQNLMGSFKNLQEISPGILETQRGKTVALGQTWEPGSKFKAEGNNLRLIEGTAYVPNFGGITRADGADFPVRFADDAGKVKPVGLDFNLMAKETPLKIQAPLNIEGFGKILGGDMVFKGKINTPEGTMGKFQFQGAQVQLDSTMGGTLDISSPASLIRANFVAEAAVMHLNSVEIQSKDKHLFVQESKPVIDLSQTDKKLTAVGGSLTEAQGQFTKAERDYSNAAVASRSLLTNVAKTTGQTDVAVFQEPDDLKFLRQEAQSVGALSSKVTEDMKAGNYQEVSEALPDLTVRTEVFKARSETVAAQAEMTKGFFKEIRKLRSDLSTVSQFVDVGDLAGKNPLTTQEVAKGYERFPTPEKKVFADTATHAQETLVKLVEAGAVDPERALDWAMSLKIAKDKVLGAGPSKLGDRVSVAAAHPQETLKEASSEAADFYVFNTLSKYAETSPKTMETVGQVGLVVSKGANALGKAAGVGLLVSFPISSVAGFSAGVTVDHSLQAAGVNQDLSEFMGTMSGMLVGGRVAEGARVSSIEKAWAARIGASEGVGQAVQEFKAGFKETMQWTQRAVQSEAGYVATGGEAQLPNFRDRVLNNIAENKSALNSSNFKSLANQEKIFRAQNAQLAPGYGGQDNYLIVPLKKGALVYGGAPGQSSFYTDIGTVKASGLDQKDLFDLLQVAPNPRYGYRPTVRAYRVMEDMEVPFGQTLANPQNGKGGGNQFFIEDWKNLDPVRDFNIQK